MRCSADLGDRIPQGGDARRNGGADRRAAPCQRDKTPGCAGARYRALDALLARLEGEMSPVVSLQPISCKEEATRLCIETCLARNWRLSMQTHKYLNIV